MSCLELLISPTSSLTTEKADSVDYYDIYKFPVHLIENSIVHIIVRAKLQNSLWYIFKKTLYNSVFHLFMLTFFMLIFLKYNILIFIF